MAEREKVVARIPNKLHQELTATTKELGISVNSFVCLAIRRFLKDGLDSDQ